MWGIGIDTIYVEGRFVRLHVSRLAGVVLGKPSRNQEHPKPSPLEAPALNLCKFWVPMRQKSNNHEP